MKSLPSAGAAIAGAGLLVALTSMGATNASTRTVRSATVPRAYRAMQRQPYLQARRDVASPTPCTSQYPSKSFVGVSASNYAGGEYSAATAGQYNEACDMESSVGTGYNNIIGNDGQATDSFDGAGKENIITSEAAFIGAGESNNASGRDASIAGGNDDIVSGSASMIGAGSVNTVSATDSFIGSGTASTVSGVASFVGSGFFATVTGNGSFIGAGGSNCNCNSTINLVSGNDSFLGAGDQNSVAALEAFLGGGQGNTITSAASEGAIAGGNKNYLSGVYGAIGGGSGNKAEGAFAVIPGGADNEAFGAASFAAGYHAEAAHAGSFVWSDDVSGSSLVADAVANQFIVRASGGTTVYSSESLGSGVTLPAGSGTWSSLSDRNAKTDISPLDDESILAKVAALPVAAWRYKTEARVRHMGPMAQDFYAAFGVGEDNRHITSIDEDGVALAAIKALHSENGRLHAQVVTQHGEIEALQVQVRRLAAEFASSRKR